MENSAELEEYVCAVAGLVDFDYETEEYTDGDGKVVPVDVVMMALCEANYLLQRAVYDYTGSFVGEVGSIWEFYSILGDRSYMARALEDTVNTAIIKRIKGKA